MSGRYVHGYTEREAERLRDPAETLTVLLHGEMQRYWKTGSYYKGNARLFTPAVSAWGLHSAGPRAAHRREEVCPRVGGDMVGMQALLALRSSGWC